MTSDVAIVTLFNFADY